MVTVYLEDRAGKRTVDPADFPLRLGEGIRADLHVPVKGTAGIYAVLGIKDRRFYVKPEDGVQVRLNGATLHGPQWIKNGDRIDIDPSAVLMIIQDGEVRITVDVGGGAEHAMGNRTMAVGPGSGSPTSSQGAAPTACLAQAIEGRRKRGEAPEAILGRHESCQVVLKQEIVSKRHAKVRRLPDGRFEIIDLQSTNGTYVNGKRITGATQILPEDRVLIGSYLLSLGEAARDIREDAAIEVSQISKVYPGGKVGLHESSFLIPSRSLLAIMGPSGCGKSTMLKCLNGYSPASGGEVKLHGLKLDENFEYLKTRIGYVPQDDIVHGQLTVEESLYFAARLRLKGIQRDEIDKRITTVLERLRISKVRSSRIHDLSGGQRKRVSIAVELLSDPLILFLDEPTSPLDPQTIEEFLQILRKLSRQGTTVVMVTHKPEDLHFMDSVMFLAEGGHLTYHGDASSYTNYFGVPHAAGVFAIISGEQAQTWSEKFRNKSQRAGTQAPGPQKPAPQRVKTQPPFEQFMWLSLRYLRIKCNDRSNLLLLLLQPCVIALLMCAIFSEITMGVLFFCAISAVWFGINNAAREIVGELPIYRRERMFNLSLWPYLVSKLIVLTAISAVQCAVFVAILVVGFFGGELAMRNVPAFTGWMLLISFASTSMGLFVSAGINRMEKVMTVVPILIIPQVMLAGVLEPIRGPFVEICSYHSFSRWGTEGFALIQQEIYGVVNPAANPPKTGIIDAIEGANPVSLGDSVLDPGGGLHSRFHTEVYEHLPAHGELTLDAAALLFLAAIFLLGAIHALRKKDPTRG